MMRFCFALLATALLIPAAFAQDDPPAASPGTTEAATADGDESTTPETAASAETESKAEVANADKPEVDAEPTSMMDRVDSVFGSVNGAIGSVIFFEVPIPYTNTTEGGKYATIKIGVLWLIIGAVFLTLRMGFINLRAFGHAIKVTAGKYDNPEDEGEVSHFQALTAALSATVGLGNIAGVAAAIAIGGPGAIVWLILAGFLGMSSKFAECTLGQKYREVRPDGRIMGGAMFYLSRGLAEKGLGGLGTVLAVTFAVLCIGGSFAGGNAFQVNQSLGAVQQTIPFLQDRGWLYGLLMTVAAGVVIIGGIKRIASTAEKIVPLMCGIYVLGAMTIIVMNYAHVPAAFGAIFDGAFSATAAWGGFVGVLVIGFQRAAFSNEAGVGSAAIAHSAAKTDYPVREGIVALLEPFVDTIVVCTMTALVIVITGVYAPPQPDGGITDSADGTVVKYRYDADLKYDAATEERIAEDLKGPSGASLTLTAMDSQISGFRYVLSAAVILFAFSTMISWSYYGERCWAFLFGDRSSMVYRVIFLIFTFLGSVISATNAFEFGDLMIFGMAIPNLIGVLLLSGVVSRDLKDYCQRLKSGEFDNAASSNESSS